LAIYYGWPSSLNSDLNQWNSQRVAADFARYSLVVLGAGLEETTHGDHENTKAIITRAKEINPSMRFVGYVTIRSLENPVSKIQKWKLMGVEGVFLDEMGFDYLVVMDQLSPAQARSKQNTWLQAVHNEGLFAMMNAWNPDDLFQSNDTLPSLGATSQDYYLFESFFQTFSNSGVQPFSDFLQKVQKARQARERYGIKFAAVNTRAEEDLFSPKDWLTLQLAARFFDISAIGWGYPTFSASSAVMPYHDLHEDLSFWDIGVREVDTSQKHMTLSLGGRSCTIIYGSDRGNDIDYSCLPVLD
jgi:hypothetical protein